MNVIRFIKSVIAEAKLTTWPNFSTVFNMTIVIILISTVLSLYITGLDIIFVKGREFLFQFLNSTSGA